MLDTSREVGADRREDGGIMGVIGKFIRKTDGRNDILLHGTIRCQIVRCEGLRNLDAGITGLRGMLTGDKSDPYVT